MAIKLIHPCPSGIPTDAFGWRAAIPGVVGPQLHTGQDWAAPAGTPVLAMHSGRVNRVWWDVMASGAPAGGNMLQIGAAQCSTRYAHLSAYAARLGDEVRAGQVIGYVGSTGAATGAHLHGELLIGGQFVDPVPYLTATPHKPETTRSKRMMILDDNKSIYIVDEFGADHLGDPDIATKDIQNSELIAAATALYGAPVRVNNRQRDVMIAIARRRWARKRADIKRA